MRSSETLTSLAVGGPCAGQVLTGQYGHLMAIVRQPMEPMDWKNQEPAAIVTLKHAHYREEEIVWDKQKVRLWVYEEIKTDAVFTELLQNYRPVYRDFT